MPTSTVSSMTCKTGTSAWSRSPRTGRCRTGTMCSSVSKAFAMRKGEVREMPVQFPETYQNRSLAGQNVTFRVVVNEIKERVLPTLNDEFAQEVGGVDTLAE